MRRALLALLALLVVSVPAIASHTPGSEGLYVGTVEEGETDVYRFDNNPKDWACPDVMRPYLVQITYAPATDELLVEVDDDEIVAEHGANATIVAHSACTAFDVAVTGVDVADVAAYELHIVQLGGHA